MTHSTSNLTGIGLRAPHIEGLLAERTSVGFLEAHSENYFGGGLPRRQIRQIAERYPLSLHGVGLSLGRADGLDQEHLSRICQLANELNPVFISEHLSWSAYSHMHVPDLLPLPATKEALGVFCDHVDEFQERLGRTILIENPSNYLLFDRLDYSEPEFLNEISARTGCGLLLDINNVHVSAHNLGLNAQAYVDAIARDGRVKEMHLAGYIANTISADETILIDTHSRPVYPQVWDLYAYALRRFGNTPTLIEWDSDIPELSVLCAEARKADVIRQHVVGGHHASAA